MCPRPMAQAELPVSLETAQPGDYISPPRAAAKGSTEADAQHEDSWPFSGFFFKPGHLDILLHPVTSLVPECSNRPGMCCFL